MLQLVINHCNCLKRINPSPTWDVSSRASLPFAMPPERLNDPLMSTTSLRIVRWGILVLQEVLKLLVGCSRFIVTAQSTNSNTVLIRMLNEGFQRHQKITFVFHDIREGISRIIIYEHNEVSLTTTAFWCDWPFNIKMNQFTRSWCTLSISFVLWQRSTTLAASAVEIDQVITQLPWLILFRCFNFCFRSQQSTIVQSF